MMINSQSSATNASLTGLRKLIHDNIVQDFQTFFPLQDKAGDSFSRSSDAE
jgi:hypothetical protein